MLLMFLLAAILGRILGVPTLEDLGLPRQLVSLAVPAAAGGAIAGLGQWLALRHLLRRPFWWMLTTAAGWIPLSFVLMGGSALVRCSFVAAGGAISGIGQWLVLRREARVASWWPLAIVISWSIGLYVRRIRYYFRDYFQVFRSSRPFLVDMSGARSGHQRGDNRVPDSTPCGPGYPNTLMS
jgi:hypothetical protein